VPPVPTNDSYIALINQSLNIPAGTGVLSNDIDPDGGNLSVSPVPVSGPSSGTLTLNADGSFSFIPQAGNTADVSFEYEVCDDGTANQLVSRFDFDTPALTTATMGPNATFINPNAVQTGCGARIPASLTGGSVGLNMLVPNTGDIFGFTSMSISFDYQDQESTADIVSGGNFRIYHITGNQLGIRIDVIDGATGLPASYTRNLGNFLAGNVPYTVEYNESTGDIILTANGTTSIFTNVAPDNSPLNTALASSLVVGEYMDNAGSAFPSLCSISVTDTSRLCDTGLVIISTQAGVITNRRITYRVNGD